MNLLDTVPMVTTTYNFTLQQILEVIADKLDVDPKTVKVHYMTDHNDVVFEVKVVIS